MAYSGNTILRNLPATAYLDWKNFETPYDSLRTNTYLAAKQYGYGLSIGQQYDRIIIKGDGTWAAFKGRHSITATEVIGIHACTKDLLRGFLDIPAAIDIHRFGEKAVRIKQPIQKTPQAGAA